mmetsp:Transcript_61590/g.71661  ORF Transcript_61590/g.71661 Transcript_61590/m.71661 type:complete len:185 (-) Transcript_61590:133-687(-)
MDLLLDDSFQSFYVELLTNFTKLAQSKYVNNLKLSSALKLSPDGAFKLSAAPLLADANGKGYNSHLSITYYLSELFMVKDALIGKGQTEELQTVSIFELAERKRPQDLLKHFDEHFLHNTLAVGSTIKAADLLLFAFFYETMTTSTDKDRAAYPSLLRWYTYVQNLDGVKQFLTESGSKFVTTA